MSLRDEILASLSEYDIRNLKIDREAEQNGVPAVHIAFETARNLHDFKFAKSLGIDAEHVATVIRSYLGPAHE